MVLKCDRRGNPFITELQAASTNGRKQHIGFAHNSKRMNRIIFLNANADIFGQTEFTERNEQQDLLKGVDCKWFTFQCAFIHNGWHLEWDKRKKTTHSPTGSFFSR